MSRERRVKAAAHRKRLNRVRVFAILALFAGLLTTAGCTGVVFGLLSEMPKLNESKAREARTTKIYSSNGKLITRLFVEQNRDVIPLKDIPKHMQQAAIAIEDERFYLHKGVDLEAIARAMWINLRRGSVVEGASTITQQYVKNTFITSERTFKRKIKEASLAYQLEQKYDKPQILARYLNTVYFGQSLYGVQTASLGFFGVKAKNLKLEQSALLAGVIRSPNNYSPYIDPKLAKKRRNLVLDKMAELDYITKKQAAAAKKKPIKLKPIGLSPSRAPYFIDYVKHLILEDPRYGPTPSARANSLYKGGLRIYTTLDLRKQKAAEDAAWSTLNQPDDPAVSLVSLEPKTGYIRAMVGGRKYSLSKFNLATQGRRQPGSAFKVFVLATALAKGYSPNRTYESGGVTISLPGEDWRVGNTEGGGGAPMTIRDGTVHSVNGVYARLMMDVGAKNVVRVAHKMGIKSHLDPWPAIALGGLRVGVTPLEMASAFGTLANGGFHNEPIAISKVTDAYGEVLFKARPHGKRALSAGVAYTAVDIMKGVIESGTGRAADIGRPAAGKTGTAQNYQDAWFDGFTPHLATAVWVGYPKRLTPMTNVHGITVMGGTFPAEIWQKYMSVALRGVPPKDFPKSKFKSSRHLVKICTVSGLLANEFCPPDKVVETEFPKGKAPKEICNIHKGPGKVRVPDVVGMSEGAAINALNSAGFSVAKHTSQNASVPAGKVYDQSPGGGSMAARGTTVSIEVSSGAPANKAPTASISLSKSGNTVSFNGGASSDPDGSIASYSWSFGDGASGSGASTSHTYANGTYTVTLTVKDNKGKTASSSASVTVP